MSTRQIQESLNCRERLCWDELRICSHSKSELSGRFSDVVYTCLHRFVTSCCVISVLWRFRLDLRNPKSEAVWGLLCFATCATSAPGWGLLVQEPN